MVEIEKLNLEAFIPDRADVFKSQGIPVNSSVPDVINKLFESAVLLFDKTVQAKFILSEISIEKFNSIFFGNGQNAKDVLLKNVYPKAENLAVFALTMGKKVSDKISGLFDSDDFALGAMLDSVASNAANKASRFCERWYYDYLKSGSNQQDDNVVLNYSPGYCGWHISGQQELFRYLNPEKIGITLNDTYLMTPLKSISGILVSGSKEIHFFNNNYSYCDDCKNQSCLERMRTLSSKKDTTV